MSRLKNRFLAFHENNPQVYAEFDRITQTLIQRGHRHYSADGVGHVMRWERRILLNGSYEFKINNNYMAFYSRMWMENNPRHAGFFRTRAQKA